MPEVEETEETTVQPATAQPTSVRTFTAEEVEKFRADERNKVQTKLSKLQTQFDELATAQAAREQAEADATAAATADAKQKAEAELEAKQLLEVRTQEWEEKFAKLEAEQKKREKLLDMERQYLSLKAYTQGRIAEETANKTIHPTFFDYIDGNTEEEINASIELAKAKTEAMAQEIQAREGGTRTSALQQGQGVTTRTGPTDFGTMSEGGDELDVESLSYADFVKNRSKLIKTNSNSGIFG